MSNQIAVRKPKAGVLAKAGDYKKELAKYAKEDSARLPTGGGASVSIKGKRFSFQGATLEEPMKAIVIDYGFENSLYEAAYDEENPQSPVCFAMAKIQEDMSPHETSPKPQSETCHDCPHNQFGSAEKGKGKACKNSIRLALISTETKVLNDEYVKKAESVIMRLPPSSLKHFRGYLKKITEGLQLPLFSVITGFSFDEEAATPIVVPQFEDEISDRKLLATLVQKRETVQETLLQPFDVSGYSDIPKKSKTKPAAKKPVVKGGKKKF